MRVGIPRALLYYEYFPMWRTFFEELGAEVIVSPPTNREIVEAGCSRLTSEICFPVRIFCGHVIYLKDGCDFIFIPSLWSVERKVYSCPKFIGLPDLIQANVPDLPPLLDPNIDVNKGEREIYQNLYRLGRPFTPNPLRIRKAIMRALEAYRVYRLQMRLRRQPPPVAIGEMFPEMKIEEAGEVSSNPSLSIALIGHPYLLYDNFINHRLIARLRRAGIALLFPEMVEEQALRNSISELAESSYWAYEEEITGAGGYYLHNEAEGIIALSAFGCGPDSLMIELVRRRARQIGKPFLSIVLDEHTAETGLMTRIEAFIDMIRRRRESPRSFLLVAPPGSNSGEKIGTVGIPSLGNVGPAFRAAAALLGIKLIAPPVTKRTITLGSRHSPEFVCLPFKSILGSFIEALEQGADTLCMVTSFNACRMGYYARVQEQILRDLGYKFKFLKFKSSQKSLPGILKAIKKTANDAPWPVVIAAYRLGTAKMKALDDLEREVQRIRPVEEEKGMADRILREAIHVIDEITDLNVLNKVVAEYLAKLRRIPRNPYAKPLKVGIVGEIFVVMEPFTNMNLEMELGKLGCEVKRTRSTFFSEWMRLGAFLNVLNDEKKKLSKFAYPYLKRDVGGHGLESLAEKVRLSQNYDGIVHLMPFTCMPEAIAQNIMPVTPGDIPILTILCDEQTGRQGFLTRLEAFVDLLRWRRRKREKYGL